MDSEPPQTPIHRSASSHGEHHIAASRRKSILALRYSALVDDDPPPVEVGRRLPMVTIPTLAPAAYGDDEDDSSDMGETLIGASYAKERVKINVGGQLHETYLATLNRLPETRLARLAQDYERDPSFDPATQTFFFNRNPIIFTSILQYYRTGELHIDYHICGNAIKNELDYWQIDPNDIEPCCWAQYAKFIENKETLKMLDDSFAVYEDLFADPDTEEGWRRLQRRLWRHIEDPSYSIVGKVFASLSIFFVVLSICSYILETHNFFRVARLDLEGNRTMPVRNETQSQDLNSTETESDDIPLEFNESNSSVVWWLSIITFICFGWFAVEYLLRLIVCPNKRDFFRSMLNNLDLLVLLAMCFETLAIVLEDLIPRSEYLRFLIPLRFARIVRIMKLMKHYRAFKVLVYTIKVSLKELMLMIIFLMIGVVIFACLVYYVEPGTFDNIPIGCWWALVTMTTVGYGDYHPNQVGGYIIGCVAAIFGVLMIAFTVPIVVNNFSLYYSHALTRAKMRPKRRATKLLNKLAALTVFVPSIKEVQEAVEREQRKTHHEREQPEQHFMSSADSDPDWKARKASSIKNGGKEKSHRKPKRVQLAVRGNDNSNSKQPLPRNTPRPDGHAMLKPDEGANSNRKRSFSMDRFLNRDWQVRVGRRAVGPDLATNREAPSRQASSTDLPAIVIEPSDHGVV